jgi:hypothetical protein
VRRRHGVGVGLATVAVICSTTLVAQSSAFADTTCNNDAHHWYGRATAPVGAGTSDGASMFEVMPTSYYAGADVTSDESIWTAN